MGRLYKALHNRPQLWRASRYLDFSFFFIVSINYLDEKTFHQRDQGYNSDSLKRPDMKVNSCTTWKRHSPLRRSDIKQKPLADLADEWSRSAVRGPDSYPRIKTVEITHQSKRKIKKNV